jgi:oligopeptide/dipeptide ABC transporter ATP-binding protein
MVPVLEIDNLTTKFYTEYGVVKAVDGVSYYVDEGEIIGLVGESGCGKSVSVLSAMQLIQSPGKIESGRVLYKGEDILKYDSAGKEMSSIRGGKIAMIFQEPMTSLNPVLSICRQLTEALEIHLDMDDHSARERAIELLSMVGVPAAARRIDDYPHQFSGGMRQRVMIAMALSCNPSLIIADEPTTAVDVTTQAQLLELMNDLVTRLNTALIIVTHNLGVVARYVQRIYVMYAGRIVESGPSEEIFENPRHPYTLGLMRSVPRLGEKHGERKLIPIYGMPPDLIHMPPTCAFLPRCTFKTERCEKDPWPDMRQVSEGHYIRCYVDMRETV